MGSHHFLQIQGQLIDWAAPAATLKRIIGAVSCIGAAQRLDRSFGQLARFVDYV